MTSTAMTLRSDSRERPTSHLARANPTYWLDSLPDAADLNPDVGPADAPVDSPDNAKALARSLLSKKDESSSALAARHLYPAMQSLDTMYREAFQDFLATDFAPDPTMLRAAAEAYLSSPDVETAAALTQASDPPR